MMRVYVELESLNRIFVVNLLTNVQNCRVTDKLSAFLMKLLISKYALTFVDGPKIQEHPAVPGYGTRGKKCVSNSTRNHFVANCFHAVLTVSFIELMENETLRSTFMLLSG